MDHQKTLVAIGGFRLHHWSLLPAFTLFAVPSFLQARRAPGCVFADVRSVDGRQFSLSAWESPNAMRAYAASGPHKRAVAAAAWLGDGPFAHYTTEGLPNWEDALAVWFTAYGAALGVTP